MAVSAIPSAAITPGDALALTSALVAVDSRNPSLVPGGPGEGEAALLLADVLSRWGFSVAVHEAGPGRPNVVARVGRGGGRSLMFNGHLDVVGIEGMQHAPFDPVIRDGRLYGRGSCDMKAGVAAMCAAAWRAARDGLRGEVIVAAVCDEEFDSLGTRALVAAGARADAAVVTEPTRLAINPAHRGFVWHELAFRGRAAHGSRYDLGIDAIRHAGLVIAELDRLERDELPQRTHPLLGRGSLHLSRISGGEGWSTYPAQCTLGLERRTLPGDSVATVRRELDAAFSAVRAREPQLDVAVTGVAEQAPSDVPVDAPIVRALSEALGAAGRPATIEGMSAWTDCALLNAAGVPAVCFGPGDITLAHAAEEYVPVHDIAVATDVLARLATAWTA
ncbi:MAG: ArgE/DapE family deacylase [Gemmatimonadota bacterium]